MRRKGWHGGADLSVGDASRRSTIHRSGMVYQNVEPAKSWNRTTTRFGSGDTRQDARILAGAGIDLSP
jgi:hypothetical protein